MPRIKKLVVTVGLVAVLGLTSIAPAFANHAPEFDHPGQAERCAATDPANLPGPVPSDGSPAGAFWDEHCG